MTEVNFELKGPLDRRGHMRHKAKSDVYIHLTGGGTLRCRAVNLSANGVALKSITDAPLALRIGSVLKITFAIHMDNSLTKLHRRMATVKHVRNGVVGLAMEPFTARS